MTGERRTTPGIKVVEDIYRAMPARDLARLADLLAPEVVLTQDERLPWGGRYKGHDGFADFALKLVGAIDSVVTTEAIFEADGTIVQCGRTRGTVRSSGVEFDIAEVHRWIIRDGRVVEAHFAIDTEAMLCASPLTHDVVA